MNAPWRELLALALQPIVHDDVDATTAAKMLTALPTHRLLLVDQACRTMRVQYGSQWRMPKGDPLRFPVDAGAVDVAACLFLAGCDSNGYSRQDAVRLAADHPSSTAIALLLIRCADWVYQVRLQAEASLRRVLARQPGLLFDQVELVARMLGHERFTQHAWPQIVAPALQAPEHAEARWRALHAGTGRQRMLIVETILAAEPDKLGELILSCLRSRDPVGARWALQQMDRTPTHAALFDDVMSIALSHPNAGVALQALRLRAKRVDNALAELIREALCSPRFSMRNLAAHLAPAQGIDALQYWRVVVDDPAHPGARHALASLCERAKVEDFERIEPWTAHPIAETRRHALAGLANADADRSAPFLQRALLSESAKEVRQALKLGKRVTRFLTRPNLVQAYQASPYLRTRAQILHAIHGLWPWDQLDALLDCAQTQDGPRDPDLADALRRWHGALIGKLEPQRATALLARVSEVAPRVPNVDWNRIRTTVENG
jgi:hypothetical protein